MGRLQSGGGRAAEAVDPLAHVAAAAAGLRRWATAAYHEAQQQPQPHADAETNGSLLFRERRGLIQALKKRLFLRLLHLQPQICLELFKPLRHGCDCPVGIRRRETQASSQTLGRANFGDLESCMYFVCKSAGLPICLHVSITLMRSAVAAATAVCAVAVLGAFLRRAEDPAAE